MTSPLLPDRSSLWLPLLRRLSETIESWYVWKNADSALHRRGDVDSAAPPAVWEVIESEFRDWARQQKLGHVIACRHIPRTLNLIVASERLPDLLQLEVKGTTTFRGSSLFRAEDLMPLTLMDPRGFRRLCPGAEGLFKFITNGVQRGGAPDYEGLAGKQVMELIEADLPGMRAAASVFGPAERWVLEAVDSARQGGWDRRALQKVEITAVFRTIIEPHILLERMWFRVVRKPFCPLLRVVYRQDRQAPRDLAGWLAEVAASHPVYSANGQQPTG